MTHAELAKKIREAVYDRAGTEGGAISREQMDDAIGQVLAAAMPHTPFYVDVTRVPIGFQRAAERAFRASVEPGAITWVTDEEWR